jgi:hypothetical protein
MRPIISTSRQIASTAFALAVLVLVAACGSSEPSSELGGLDDDSDYGDEGDDEYVDGDLDEPDVDEPPSGPVQVTLQVRLAGEDLDAPVEVQSLEGETVSSGRSGASVSLRPGTYVVRVPIEDESKMIDTPTFETEINVDASDEPQTIPVNVAVAQILLDVRLNGRPLRNPNVTLYREGDEEESVAQFRVGRNHVPISPGRYEAEVVSGGGTYRIRGLTFMDGARQTIPVNVQ